MGCGLGDLFKSPIVAAWQCWCLKTNLLMIKPEPEPVEPPLPTGPSDSGTTATLSRRNLILKMGVLYVRFTDERRTPAHAIIPGPL